MKLVRLALPAPSFIGALSEIVQSIDAERKGCELVFDPRTGCVAIYKGDKVSLVLPSGAVGDVADDQGETDVDDAPGGAAPAARRRGRPPKNPPPVQT